MELPLRLWALPVTDVRQFFAAPPAETERLTTLAKPLLAPIAPPASPGLLGKLGPITKKHPALPVITPGVPNYHDLTCLLAGRYVEANRLSAAWRIMVAWLDGSAGGRATIGLDPASLDQLEFDLGRCEVPYDVSIRRLWGHTLEIPLQPLPNQHVGYLPADHVSRLDAEWRRARADLEETSLPFVDAVLAFTTAIVRPAEIPDRPLSDLVASWI